MFLRNLLTQDPVTHQKAVERTGHKQTKSIGEELESIWAAAHRSDR
jgi:hypothetical protein